jgi:hypothetical protein
MLALDLRVAPEVFKFGQGAAIRAAALIDRKLVKQIQRGVT